jgi:hypothetical protein
MAAGNMAQHNRWPMRERRETTKRILYCAFWAGVAAQIGLAGIWLALGRPTAITRMTFGVAYLRASGRWRESGRGDAGRRVDPFWKISKVSSHYCFPALAVVAAPVAPATDLRLAHATSRLQPFYPSVFHRQHADPDHARCRSA